MKRILSMLAVMGMVVSMMVPTVTAGSVFDDVSDTSEFAQYIHGLYNEGVISGLGGNYYPFNNVTRAEMAKMSVNGAGLEMKEAEGAPHFDDVPRTHSLYSFVETAYAYGIVSGRGERTFAPDEPVLRQEAMKIAMGSFRTNDTEGYFAEDLSGAPHFSDVPASNEFYGDIETAYNLGIVNGYGDGRFGPMDQMRRDQMAKVVHNSMRVARGEDVKGEEGYVLKVGVSADEVRNDGSSLVQVTATIEKDGAVDDNYSEPVKFETTLGEWENDESDFTDTASEGRAHATLTASDEEGTATITVTAPGVPTGTAQVVFSSDAPRTKKGFGSNRVSGVGSMQVIAADSDIMIDASANQQNDSGFNRDYPPIIGGQTFLEVYIQDTDDIPVSNDNVICTIIQGEGALYNSWTAGAFPAPTTVQSVTMTAQANGRYIGRYVVLDDASEDNIEIECIDLDTSPSLTARMDIDTNNVTLDAWANHDELLTRNMTQVTAGTNIVQNAATIIVQVSDVDGDPIRAEDREIDATIIDGDDANSALIGDSNAVPLPEPTDGPAPDDSDDDRVRAIPLMSTNGRFIPGFYYVQYIAGTSEGTVTIQFRDVTAIGGSTPSTTVDLQVYNPKFEVFKSADRVGQFGTESDGSSLLVAVRDNDDVPVPDETVCSRIVSDAGTGSTLGSPIGPGSCTGGIQMAQVLDNSGNPTGFYIAQYLGPTTLTKNDATDFEFYSNVDRTGVEIETDSVDVQQSSTPNEVVDDLELIPVETVIGPAQEVFIVVFAKDDEGYGVECLADTVGFGTGCPVGHYDPGDLDVKAIQNGTYPDYLEEFRDDGLGYGAYYTQFNADQVGGTKGEIQITAPTVTPVQARQRFDIVDNEIEFEFLDDTIRNDEAIGGMVYAYDHNDDPVYGLVAGGNLQILDPNYGDINVQREGELFDPNFGAFLTGSGVYAFAVNTNSNTNKGTVNQTVSAVIGRTIDDSDSFAVEYPEIDLNCYPEFAVTNNTMACTVIVRDEHGNPLRVRGNAGAGSALRVTTSLGDVEAGNNNPLVAPNKVDLLSNNEATEAAFNNSNGVYIFSFEAGAIEDTAEITVELYSEVIAHADQANPNAKLLDSVTYDLDIR